MAEEENEFLDQRHLDQNVARADADEVQQESPDARFGGQPGA